MKKTNIGLLLSLLLSMLSVFLWRCKDPYVSPYVSPPTGYLVIEGYISGNDTTTFTLSRSIPLPGTATLPLEDKAQVQVEGNDNSVYPLTEQSKGVYVVDTLPLKTTVSYRLRIKTSNGESYLSDFVPYKVTPLIDSVNWINYSDHLEIYANAHDPANATHYYQWNYDEVWEYHSAEESFYFYDADTVAGPNVYPRNPNQNVFRCWHFDNSTTIILGSSAKLAQDVIYLQPVNSIPENGQQLSVLYSILVRQYALTEDGYNFLTLMQKNTESLGSIFDVQPSELKGNIHSLSNAAEPVIGYISAGTVQKKRIFIKQGDVSGWQYIAGCDVKDTIVAPKHYVDFFPAEAWIPTDTNSMGSGYFANVAGCIDCRTQGGVLQPPPFWPN